MSSHHKNSKSQQSSKTPRQKRTPRTLVIDEQPNSQLPALFPEGFRLKNFDLVGKIDDMRVLTKELSVMARQLEQWMSVAHTVVMAFKDNGVLREVVKALANVNLSGGGNGTSQGETPKNKVKKPAPPPFMLPFFGNMQNNDDNEEEDTSEKRNHSQEENPFENINIFEIIKNPAFQDMMAKLFLQKK
ncbi:hypothetical protein TEPIDINF_001812 [Tepidibacillus infernus]|uniref:hypothetical protein n=1 Tax=Tepidibacillus infernus TaxID=1806172 RepID=UPI003B711DFC